MFTNKHVIIALIVAPILSVLAWFMVGSLIGEEPAPAESGKAYPLVAKSNCRWASGACDLENQDFSVTLRFTNTGTLKLTSRHPLQGVLVSVYDPGAENEMPPVSLVKTDGAGLAWHVLGIEPPAGEERIRLVASADGSQYYGEAATQFAQASENAIPNPD